MQGTRTTHNPMGNSEFVCGCAAGDNRARNSANHCAIAKNSESVKAVAHQSVRQFAASGNIPPPGWMKPYH